MATIKYRIEEEKAEWIIYVTDSGQSTHFDVLQKCAAKCGILNPEKVRIDFVGFGVVLGEDKKKFKTRSGIKLIIKTIMYYGLNFIVSLSRISFTFILSFYGLVF